MDPSRFDALIDGVRSVALPTCPSNLEERVVGRIRAEQTAAGECGVFGSLEDWLPRPVFVVTAMAAAVFMTAGFTYLSRSPMEWGKTSERVLASRALGFDVFERAAWFELEAPGK